MVSSESGLPPNHQNDDWVGEHHTTESVQEDSHTTVLGGALRSIVRNFRNVARTVSRATVGRLPHLPVRTVARSADRLGDMVELTDQFRTAHEDIRTDHRDGSKSLKTPSAARGKWAHLHQVMRSATPNFIKSTLLGTLVFDVYERFAENAVVRSDSNIPRWVVSDTGMALLGGTVGGFAHGLGYAAWNRVAERGGYWTHRQLTMGRFPWLSAHMKRYAMPLSALLHSRVHIGGTLSAHSLVHAGLFGSYAAAKLPLLEVVDSVIVPFLHDSKSTKDLPREKLEHYLGFGCVVIAGAVAAVVSESLSSVVAEMEMEGIGPGKPVVELFYQQSSCGSSSHRLRSFPQITQSLASMCPSASELISLRVLLPGVLGFVAYEYGREFVQTVEQYNHLEALRQL